MAELLNLNYNSFKEAQAMRASIEEFGVWLKQVELTNEIRTYHDAAEFLQAVQYEFYEILKENKIEY